MRILLLLLLASQLDTSLSQDLHHYLKVQFLHELARNGPISWKCLCILLDDHVDDIHYQWISDVNIPKIIITPSSNVNIPIKLIDAYLIFTTKELLTETENSISNLIKSKQLDPTERIIIFSDNSIQLLQSTDLDQMLVQPNFRWNTRTGLSDQPILKIHHYRPLTSLKPTERTGIYDGSRLTSDMKRLLFDQSFNYGDKDLKVTTFLSPPTTIECKYDDQNQLCGRDPNLIRAIGEILHFRPIFLPPKLKGSKWGDRLNNGTWTGLIGDVSSGTTTLGVANVFTTQHYTEQVEMSYPYDISCSTFLTPPPEPWPQFYALIKPFDPLLWLITFLSLFLGGMLIQLIAIAYRWLFGKQDQLCVFGEAMIYNAQSITGVRAGSGGERSAWPVRIYNSNWWLFCFVLGTIYRTGLTSWLALSPVLMNPIDTVNQLVHSNLKPYGFNTFVRDLAQYSNDPDTIALGQRLELVPCNVTVQMLMTDQNGNALYENKNYLKYLASTILPSATKNISVQHIDPRLRLHVMRECLRSFPVAIAMTPGTDLKSPMTRIIHQLNAAGLVNYWLDSVVDEVTILRKQSKNESEPTPISLYHLEGAFYLLLLCYGFSMVSFIAELAVRYVFCRHYVVIVPSYD